MGHLSPFETAPADYPNHLAERQPERLRLPSARWLLPLLVLLCLVPRVVMALRIPGICPDGVLYIEIARNLEAGQLAGGVSSDGPQRLPRDPLALAPSGARLGSGCGALGSRDFESRGPAALGLGAAAIRRPRGLGRLLALRGSSEVHRMEPRGDARSDLLAPFHAGDLLAMARGDRSPLRLVHCRRRRDYAGLVDPHRGPLPADSPGDLDVLAVVGTANWTQRRLPLGQGQRLSPPFGRGAGGEGGRQWSVASGQ